MQIIIFIILLLNTSYTQGARSPLNKFTYRSHFANCPQKTTAQLTLDLVRDFDQNGSLFSMKKKILNEGLLDKYFISDYRIDYSPIEKELSFFYECPQALLKVQIFKPDGNEHYNAILVEGGRLLDPIYEVSLRSEGLIDGRLPFLAVQIDSLSDELQKRVAILFKMLPQDVRVNLSEIIISDEIEATLMMSLSGQSVSVFLGEDLWVEKSEKLTKVLSYLNERNKVPSIVNMTSLKKIVVKFSRTL